MDVKEQLAALCETTPFSLYDLVRANYSPHPYMVGAEHVAYAADHNSGYLTEESIAALERQKGRGMCKQRGCSLYVHEHKSDYIALFELRKDKTPWDAFVTFAQDVLDPFFKRHGIDGFNFMEQPDKKFKEAYNG